MGEDLRYQYAKDGYPLDLDKIKNIKKILVKQFPCGVEVPWVHSPENAVWKDNGWKLSIHDITVLGKPSDNHNQISIKSQIMDTEDRVLASIFTQTYSFKQGSTNIKLDAIELSDDKSSSGLNIGGKILQANQEFILHCQMQGTMHIWASSHETLVGGSYWAPRYFNFADISELEKVRKAFKDFYAAKQKKVVDMDFAAINTKLDCLQYPFEFYAFDDGCLYKMKNTAGENCNVGKYILSNHRLVRHWFGSWNEQYASTNHPIRKGCDKLLAQKGKKFAYPDDIDEIIKAKHFYLEY